jgi:hypothetical protein
MRVALRLPIGLTTAALLTAGTASAAEQVSKDPFKNADSQHATQVEPDTFSNGLTVVSAFQSGRFFDGGSSDIGFATSTDGGATWMNGFLPSMTVNSKPAGKYARASDPSVAYDAKHDTWMIESLGISSAGAGLAVLVSRSTDGGATWEAPVEAATTNGFFDKTWIVCDNSIASSFYGHCYATWDDANNGDLLLTSTSSDGGATWGTAKTTKDGAFGLGGQPLVRPDGIVVVPVLGNGIIAYRSKNGGKSWSSSVTVSNQTDHGVAGNLRTEPLPSAEIDAKGKVYTVWQDCRFRSGCSSNDIVMSTSTNGKDWTTTVRIPIDPVSSTVDHFIPGLAVDKTTSGNSARLALTYYYYPNAKCTQATCQLFVGFVSSVDGGQSWSAPQTLAGPMSLNDLANTSGGLMVGDYISTSFSGVNAVTVFANAMPKQGTVYDESMYSASIPVTAAQAYPLKVGDDAVVSTYGDRPIGTRRLVTP